jgi:predicted dehydrogenase/threonine dehydrogenase-like Zn-dependent dehydrogenase
MSGVKASGIPLWKRALKEPENVKKAVQMITKDGVLRARNEIRSRMGATRPSGYSAAGVVLEVGEGVDDLVAGERVACAGAECAFHAEVIRVPRNLTVPVPDAVSLADASTVTLGAIALQGIRRAQPTLGETFAVIGLGILGQLTVQMLKANGCKVIGTDVESGRIERGLESGMDSGIHPGDGDAISRVARLTDGFGVDGAIITAATPADDVVSTAFQVCRKKGRVVLVGDVGLNLDRRDLYIKELDFLISTSYGPGRYERRYEEEGLDYPLAFVRWTENRNMAEYLRLLAEGKVRLGHCIDSVYPLADASEAYDALSDQERRPLMVLLRYPARAQGQIPRRRTDNPRAHPSSSGRIRIAVVGAGSYAKFMHLPTIQSLSGRFHLQAVVSRTGHNAKATAEQFGASYATTDYSSVLEDPEVDAVLIATRHNLHASMVLDALKAGKHVLVEKPLALTPAELVPIEGFYSELHDEESVPVLMTGFNRRFSRHLRRIHELVRDRTNPMIVNYRMNAGYIPLDHWVHSEEGGGRNRGEACHIYDVFQYLIGQDVDTVHASSVRPTTGYYGANDNFVASLRYQDGSVATLTYTALGAMDYPKERLDLFSDGRVISLDDYVRMDVVGPGGQKSESKGLDKGQKAELIAFGDVIQKGGEWPMSLRDQLGATKTAILVEDCLQSSGEEETSWGSMS